MSTSAISAGHEVTLQLAQEILKMGGNAFDAAITAHLAMYITEPCMASAGAGGFALCHTPNSRVQMLDFFTQTPLEKRKIKDLDFYPIQVNFGNENEEFHVGAASMATPGSIAAIFELHRKLGSLPMDVLIDPVLDLAKNGVILNTFQKIDLDLLEPIFKNDPSVRNIFFKEGKLLNEGDLLYFPHFADFLEFLKKEKDEGFYKGEIGKKIADYAQEQGGFLQRKDFENYKAYWRPTITAKHFGHEVHLPNGPSIGGAIMFVLLSNFEKFDGNWLKAISQTLQECKSISGIEFQIRNRYPSMAFDLHGKTNATKGTSHFNIIDKWNNAISLTCSLGEGAGYFIPGTDMQMNNMLGESFLLPNGFHSWVPNTRLNSMMTPTMVLDQQHQIKYIGGSGGAGRIPYMIAQVLEKIFNLNFSLDNATEAPRIYVHDSTVHFEQGFNIDRKMLDMHHNEWNEKSLFFGGVHSIFMDERMNKIAKGDSRRYGVGHSIK